MSEYIYDVPIVVLRELTIDWLFYAKLIQDITKYRKEKELVKEYTRLILGDGQTLLTKNMQTQDLMKIVIFVLLKTDVNFMLKHCIKY